MGLAVVRDMREARVRGPDEVAAFETDVLAGFVLARAAAGLSDKTVSADVSNLEQVRAWFGRPLWEMRPAGAGEDFGKVMRAAAQNTRLKRAQALKVWFAFLELRHKAEISQLTGCAAECPVDEVNRPRGGGRAALRIPPEAAQVGRLFTGWRGELATCREVAPAAGDYAGARPAAGGEELATCRKFAPAARNYAAAGLMAEVGLRVNEARMLDLDDVRWELGRFGKLHVRHGKGARGSGPRERMVPLINGAGRTLRWFIEDVRGLFGDDFARHGAPLLPSERHEGDGTAARAGAETLRAGLAAAAAAHLPEWDKTLTPHVLRHFCASQLYLGGMDLLAIQEALGHAWVATTMGYVHVHATHVEDARIAGQERAATRLEGLAP